MPNRAVDWFNRAATDLEHPEDSRRAGRHAGHVLRPTSVRSQEAYQTSQRPLLSPTTLPLDCAMVARPTAHPSYSQRGPRIRSALVT
jgi:hypothetical protein